jgi:bifunctional ADP-heptose synthase (sugar kinase/adenylyltransferase)
MSRRRVVVADPHAPLNLIKAIWPDVLVTAGHKAPEWTAAEECVMSYGGRVVTCPAVESSSRTENGARV